MSLHEKNNLTWVSCLPSASQLTVKDEAGKVYVATKVIVNEALSKISDLTVTLLSSSEDATVWLGQTITCDVYDNISTSREAIRSYKGVVVGVEMLFNSEMDQNHCFLLNVQPWLGLLKYSRNYRVFQEKSSQEIVTFIFDELGFKGKYKVNALASTKRKYCLQYNETDYAFISRILAQEGIHFYFERDANNETLVLQDAAKPFTEDDKVSFDCIATRAGTLPLITDWAPVMKYHAAKLELASYDPDQTKLVTSAATASRYTLAGNSKLIDFRYPQASITGAQADIATALIKIKRGQLDSEHSLVSARAESPSISCGNYINLATHSDASQVGDYLVIASEYQYDIDVKGRLSQQLAFSCCPKGHAFFPPKFSKPKIYGLHSAVIAGPKKGEPSNDDEARVKIKFHWDDNTGDKTSCWVRVAQSMAGNGYGLQFIPRAGQEVLVSFLDGDIDRPVVTGSLYNSNNKAPYAKQDTTHSGIKTKLEGESNELRFDDKKDNEQLFLHAAKDFALEIENDSSIKVLNDSKEEVTGNSTSAVEKDITTTTNKNYSLTAKEKISAEGQTIILEAKDSLTLKVGSSELKMTGSKIEIKSSEILLKGSSEVTIDGGQVNVKGSSKIDIKSGGSVAIKATSDLKAGGLNAEIKADVGATVKGGATAEISASGITVVKGAMVNIN